MRSSLVFGIVAVMLVGSAVRAEDWNQFLGPNGNGTTSETRVPTQWGPDQNIKWKVKLPQPGNGSPITSQGRVFVTCAEDEQGHNRSLYCFDRRTGDQLWVRTVDFGKTMPTHKTNPYCASTPASDGKHVVVWHGSAGMYCYDMDGNQLWMKELGEFRHMWGYASSPIIHGNRVYQYCGPGAEIYVTAMDLATGETIWRTDEPQEGDGEHNASNLYMGSWVTPVIAKVDGHDQLIVTMPTRVNGYDLDSGKIIWWCEGIRGEKGDLAYSSPMIKDDVLVQIGGFSGPSLAMRLGGTGNVTESNRMWRKDKNPQSIGTGVFLGDHIYRPNAGPGTIDCLEAKTGEVVWTDRALGSCWSSVVMVGDVMMVTNQEGMTLVFKPNPVKLDVLAENALGETSNATPAVSNGELFIRTDQHLYCIAEASD